jgi:putative flippase GtrA
MKTYVFQKKSTLGYRLEVLFWTCWEKPFIRFLFVGGLNTALGYLVTVWLRYGIFIDDPKWFLLNNWLEIDIANSVMFIILFPVAYSLQAWLAFRTPWRWQRLLLYPLSSIPNYALQQGFIYLFETGIGLPPSIAYGLAAIMAIPLMFIIIRFLITPKPKPLL